MDTLNGSGSSNPLISVMMPSFKAGYLKEAISGILNQEFRDFELVVVDDASPEDLKSIVDGFEDSRLSYVRNPENIGSRSLVENWNGCLARAKGEFLVLASDDDIYHPGYLTRMLALAAKYPTVDVFRCRVSIIDRSGAEIDRTFACPEFESWDEFLWHRIRGARTHFIPECMFRTRALRESGGFVEFPFAWASDSATIADVGRNAGICCAQEMLLSWRSSGANISTSDRFALPKLQGFLEFLDWIKARLEEHRPPLKAMIEKALDSHRRQELPYYLKALPPATLLGIVAGGGSLGRKVERSLAVRAALIKGLGR